jgi:hypothetical protein
LAYVLGEPDGTRVIVAPLKLNHPAVSVSNPLKYGPGGASAALSTPEQGNHYSLFGGAIGSRGGRGGRGPCPGHEPLPSALILGAMTASSDRGSKRNAHKERFARPSAARSCTTGPRPRMVDVCDWDFATDGKIAWLPSRPRRRPVGRDVRRRLLAK